MDGDFATAFVRRAGALRKCPALVLNADYRPLSYLPLSLWRWQDARFSRKCFPSRYARICATPG